MSRRTFPTPSAIHGNIQQGKKPGQPISSSHRDRRVTSNYQRRYANTYLHQIPSDQFRSNLNEVNLPVHGPVGGQILARPRRRRRLKSDQTPYLRLSCTVGSAGTGKFMYLKKLSVEVTKHLNLKPKFNTFQTFLHASNWPLIFLFSTISSFDVNLLLKFKT